MSWAGYVAHRETEERFWWKNLRERDHLEDQGVDGRVILKLILKKSDLGSRDCNYLAQDTDSWRTLVNAVMNLRVS
jgi:hypothetical protein